MQEDSLGDLQRLRDGLAKKLDAIEEAGLLAHLITTINDRKLDPMLIDTELLGWFLAEVERRRLRSQTRRDAPEPTDNSHDQGHDR